LNKHQVKPKLQKFYQQQLLHIHFKQNKTIDTRSCNIRKWDAQWSVTITIKKERISRVSYHLVLCHWFKYERNQDWSCRNRLRGSLPVVRVTVGVTIR